MSSAPLQGFITLAVIFLGASCPCHSRASPKQLLAQKAGNSNIPDLVTSLWPPHPLQGFPEEFGKQRCWFFPIFLFTFHPLGMSLGIFLSLISFLQSCFHPFPSFLWRKTGKAEPKPLGTGRFRDQNPSFHHLFHLS